MRASCACFLRTKAVLACTCSPPGRRLTLPGVKRHRVMCPLYDYYCLYAAVEPVSGEALLTDPKRSARHAANAEIMGT
jgi:hypothetical protein